MRTNHVVTMCHQCGQWDDHPKVVTGYLGDIDPAGIKLGWSKHHDCVDLPTKLAMLAGPQSQHPLIMGKIFDACEKQGLKGNKLRQFILSAALRDFGKAEMMAGGIDQTFANAVLTAMLPGTGTTTIGALTITAPIKCRFDSAMGSDTAAATEWGTSGGYTAGGVSVGNNWAAASAGSRATTASAVSVTGAPAQTWAGNELWDSSPQREMWGPLAGGNKTVNSGDTATLLSLAGGLA